MMVATRLRAGMTIIHEGRLCKVTHVDHVTPGKGYGMVQAKMKDVKTGRNVEYRYRSSEKIERAHLETREMEYLYPEGEDIYVFMDSETFDQHRIPADLIGDDHYYMLPNTAVQVEMYEGEPLGIQLPKVVEMEVTETEPSLKGATAQAHNKPATLETGLTVSVPPFISKGDVVRVDTESGEYLERAK